MLDGLSYKLSLIETKKGSSSLQMKGDDGSIKTIHSLYDPEAEAKTIVDAFQFNGKGLLVILGLGLGYHVVELIKKFPEANTVVLEAVPEIYELAKEYGRVSEIGDKVRFLIGCTTDEAISEITGHQIRLGMPPLNVFTLSSAVSAFPGYYRPIYDRLKNISNIRLGDKLRYPKFKEDALKIALIDFNYFLNREVEKAIKVLGHQVAKVTGSIEESAGDMLSRIIKMIIDFKPDFILTINHFGFDEEGILTNFLKSIEMPVGSWYVDSPNIIVKAFGENVSPYVSIFLWDKGYKKDIEGFGFLSITYLPLATDEAIFKPIKLSQRDSKTYRADVGFVGNSMIKPTIDKLEKVPKELHSVVEGMARFISSSRVSFDDALKTAGEEELERFKSLLFKEMLDFEAAVLWRATLLYRSSCIEKLKEFNPHIHGDIGWKTLLDRDYNIRGPLHYYKELPLFYNACEINFNATSLQMGEAVNQRVFDVPACGAFILTDHQRAIEELFEMGKEIVTYKDKDEISELVRFYLHNPGAREAIAIKGRERVLKEHTYKHRLNVIIHTMEERYKYN